MVIGALKPSRGIFAFQLLQSPQIVVTDVHVKTVASAIEPVIPCANKSCFETLLFWCGTNVYAFWVWWIIC